MHFRISHLATLNRNVVGRKEIKLSPADRLRPHLSSSASCFPGGFPIFVGGGCSSRLPAVGGLIYLLKNSFWPE